jgi:hypothetical protein
MWSRSQRSFAVSARTFGYLFFLFPRFTAATDAFRASATSALPVMICAGPGM